MQIYRVGGAVRDKLLNYPCHENDWVVVGSSPEEMVALDYRPVGQDFPVFIDPRSGEEHALARGATTQRGSTCSKAPSTTLTLSAMEMKPLCSLTW